MKFRILFISLILSVSVVLHAGDKAKIKVLIIDGYSNHDWRYTTEVINALLKSTDYFSVETTTAPENDDPSYDKWDPRFDNYDVVIQNTNSLGNENYWPEKVQRDFEKYMIEGGGMYVYHSANNSFEKWGEYNKMIGLGWRAADKGFAIEIREGEIVRIPPGEGNKTSHGPRLDILVEKYTDHPINRGYPERWISPDVELYKFARGPAENMKVLSTTLDTVTGKRWPVEWVVKYGKGRVYNSTFGHIWHDVRMPESIRCVGFQTNFIRAMQWLAGREVTYPVPENFPDEQQAVINPVKLQYEPEFGWKSLFDGKSLEGWDVKCTEADLGKNYWRVSGENIECNSIGRGDHDYFWLTSQGEYGDFQLRLKFQVFKSSPGNSGIQFRSSYDDSETARKGGWLHGPQADIHPPNPMRTGLIYDETDGVNRWIYPSLPDWNISTEQVPKEALRTNLLYADNDPEAWNTMEIICEGMQIETFVNGLRVTDFNAEGILNDAAHLKAGSGLSGFIALQLHTGDELLIRFRDIYIREL